jgi:hypothetical protein
VAGYDPQRTRHRPRPGNGSAAPIDTILDGPSEHEDEPVVTDESGVAQPLTDEAPAAEDTVAAPPAREPAEPETTSAAGMPDPDSEGTVPAVDLSAVPPPPPGPSPARLVLAGGVLAIVLAVLVWLWRRSSSSPDES